MDEDRNFSDDIPDELVEKKKKKLARMKNLHQYKDLSEEQFQNVLAQRALGLEVSDEFEKRIEKKWKDFDSDYDLSDLKINDKETLRALIQAIINLEDYEQHMYRLRSSGITSNNISEGEKVQKLMSDLRSDISKLQNDLNITRKIRKSDQDVSVLAFIDNLKDKAKKFYENKMGYIFCPKCNMLLGTVWVQYHDEDRNKVALVCNRLMPDGSKCGEKTLISVKDLIKNRGTTNKIITPESML